MEIIKSGKDRREEVTCIHCGSRIAYSPDEVLTRLVGKQVTIFGLERNKERYILCPACNNLIML